MDGKFLNRNRGKILEHVNDYAIFLLLIRSQPFSSPFKPGHSDSIIKFVLSLETKEVLQLT